MIARLFDRADRVWLRVPERGRTVVAVAVTVLVMYVGYLVFWVLS